MNIFSHLFKISDFPFYFSSAHFSFFFLIRCLVFLFLGGERGEGILPGRLDTEIVRTMLIARFFFSLLHSLLVKGYKISDIETHTFSHPSSLFLIFIEFHHFNPLFFALFSLFLFTDSNPRFSSPNPIRLWNRKANAAQDFAENPPTHFVQHSSSLLFGCRIDTRHDVYFYFPFLGLKGGKKKKNKANSDVLYEI